MTRVLLLHNIINPHMTPVFTALARAPGVDLTVAYFAATEAERSWRRDLGEGFPSHVLPGRELRLRLSWDTFSVHVNPGLHRFLRETPFDVLVNAGWASLSNWQAFLDCRLRGRPQVLWAGSTAAQRSLQRTLTLPAVRRLVRGSDAWVSYGAASADYLVSLGADRARTIPSSHCVDNARFLSRRAALLPSLLALRARLGLQGAWPVVLFVGSLIERKGAEVLIDAFARLRRDLPGARLLLCGDGVLRERLQAQARAAVGDAAIFAGKVDLDELPAYYALADLFVLPSLEEVWGLVANEAALSGLPLILSDGCGAAPELLREGENGRLFPPGDAAALCRAMADVLSSRERARALGEASRRLVERCSPEGVAAALLRGVRLAQEARGRRG